MTFKSTAYQVMWDNGNAVDVFPEYFDTKESAEAYGNSWLAEMKSIDPHGFSEEDGDDYLFEVIAVTLHPDDDPIDYAPNFGHDVEGSFGHFERYIG
jgi:hypothetical protein